MGSAVTPRKAEPSCRKRSLHLRRRSRQCCFQHLLWANGWSNSLFMCTRSRLRLNNGSLTSVMLLQTHTANLSLPCVVCCQLLQCEYLRHVSSATNQSVGLRGTTASYIVQVWCISGVHLCRHLGLTNVTDHGFSENLCGTECGIYERGTFSHGFFTCSTHAHAPATLFPLTYAPCRHPRSSISLSLSMNTGSPSCRTNLAGRAYSLLYRAPFGGTQCECSA
jgi:hypothetical protein